MLLTKLQILFEFTGFPPMSFCSFRILSKIPNCICDFSLFPLICVSPLVTPCLAWPWHFWTMSLNLGMSDVFSWLELNYEFLAKWHNRNYVSLSVCYIKRFMMLTCLIIGHVNLDHLVMLVSTRFFHCKVNIFPFVIIIFGSILWVYTNSLFPQTLVSIGGSCLQQLLLYFMLFLGSRHLKKH